ncbi:hypothetical protein [Microcoleus sp. CAWBG640]|uniref:hypothetical protein n=1 Tax=Microcoleus sp. CAWBG640 TaxID=2841653 RepID=UPI00312B6296
MSITRTTKVSRSLSTNSDENGENFEAPQDASDILDIDTEIGRQGTTGTPRRSPTGGGIDLRKGPDLQKPRSPTRGPGIGIEIGKSEAGNLGIGVEIPIPVPAPISARGKIAIDPATGKIRGGGLGIAIGKGPLGAKIDIGRDTPRESEKLGCFHYLTISIGPFSHTFGKNECEPKEDKKEPPTPIIPTPAIPPILLPDPSYPNFKSTCKYWVRRKFKYFNFMDTPAMIIKPSTGGDYTDPDSFSRYAQAIPENHTVIKIPGRTVYYVLAGDNGRTILTDDPINSPFVNEIICSSAYYNVTTPYSGTILSDCDKTRVRYIRQKTNGVFGDWVIASTEKNELESVCPPSPPPPPFSPSIPNPQPTKKKMNDCCEVTKALQLETLRMLGRQVVNGKLQPITNVKGFLGEEIARIETPIKDPTKPKTIKLKFNSIYDLLVYCLKQSNNLDTALDPQSYKPAEGNLQNPEYQRDTKHSLTNNRQPGDDASGRRREFKINKDKEVIFRGFLQEQRYIFEAIKRFEYLFPYGEFSNFKIDKSLIVPSTQKAEIQVHNTFHAFEVLFQYLNSSLGNPREEIHIGDTNPGKKGSQPITFTPFSVSHLMREVFKYLVDLEGDQDSQLNLALRDFRTNLANRVQIIQIHEMTKALFEDTGMVEQQDFVTVKLEGDPYAGNFKNGEFLPSEELDENTEEATEKLLAATLQNFEMQVKVLRRDNKKDPNDLRDVIIELYNKLVEQSGGTAGGDDLIKKELEKAKFNVELDGALTRVNVKKAQATSSYKTRKKRR